MCNFYRNFGAYNVYITYEDLPAGPETVLSEVKRCYKINSLCELGPILPVSLGA
jgi:hypothetical protein